MNVDVKEVHDAFARRESISGALRREVVATIQALIKELRPTLPLISSPIDHRQRYIAGDGWRYDRSDIRAFCAYSESSCEGHSRPHSWTGAEVWVGEDGKLWEVEVEGWYSGLGCAGEVVEEEKRTIRQSGAREIARKYGTRFIDTFAAKLIEAAKKAHEEANNDLPQIGKLRRLQFALTGDIAS